MNRIFRIYTIILISFPLLIASNTPKCELEVISGQIVSINRWRFSNCTCLDQTNLTDLKSYPSWLVKHRNNQSWQGVPSVMDAGRYRLTDIFANSGRVGGGATDKDCYYVLKVVAANSTDSRQFRCNIRWPTVAAIILDIDLDTLSPTGRLSLWTALKSNLKGAAGLRILESIPAFDRSAFVLASGVGNQDGPRRSHKGGVAVVWQIGCGSVEVRHLKLLQWLEKSALIGELSQLLQIDDKNRSIDTVNVGNTLSPVSVQRWLVADLHEYGNDQALLRFRRQAAVEMDTRFSGTLLEGSGLPPPTSNGPGGGGGNNKQKLNKKGEKIDGTRDGSGDSGPNLNVVTSPRPIPIGPSTPFLPELRRKLNKIVLTIHQINNFKIPRDTFYDPQDGYSPNLIVKVYYFSNGRKKETEIIHNDSNWISYDKDLQNIRFLARPAHIGTHTIKLCATDKSGNSICEKQIVEVRPPTPISKTTVLQISAGALWTYKMPTQWLDGLTYNSTADLDMTIQGEAIFHWDEKKSILQVLTEAVESRILKITFNITNPREYQTLRYEFTLAVSDVSPISTIMSDIFQFRLRWTGPNLYPLDSVREFLTDLAKVLENTNVVTGKVNPADLLVYRVLYSRNFLIKQRNTSPDDILSLQIVYWPDGGKAIECNKAALRGLVKKVQEQQQFASYYIDSVTRIPLKGRCNHSLRPSTTTKQPTSSKKVTTPKYKGPSNEKAPNFNPSVLISNFEVKAGHAFMKELDLKSSINEKLVRYLSLVDIRNQNITDDNWVGLSNSSLFIYGLPLKHHVRRAPYQFFIIINTVTGHRLSASFSISVQQNYWTNNPINHLIKLKLRLVSQSSNRMLNMENQMVSSLSFRYSLIQTIDTLLTKNCKSRCAMNIVLFDIKIMQKSLLSIEWSYLPLLSADGDPNKPDYQCSWSQLTGLYRSLNGITNYPIDSVSKIQQMPAQALSETLVNAKIGSVVGLTIERLGICSADPPESLGPDSRGVSLLPNITAFCGQGFRVPIKFVQGGKSLKSKTTFVQLYYQNKVIVSKTYWMTVSSSNVFIYGLPLSIHATEKREYVLHLHPQNGRKIKSPFLVTVLANPFASGATINHEVRMRLAHISYVPLTDEIIAGLDLRWRVAAALDSFIRPQCVVSNSATDIPECAWRLDVVLFEVARISDTEASSSNMANKPTDATQDLFDVKWAMRSVLQFSSSNNNNNGPRVLARQRRAVAASANVPSTNIAQPCPENRLLLLQRRLFGEAAEGPKPSQKLQLHLRANAGVEVKTLNIVRYGACASSDPSKSNINSQTWPRVPKSRPNKKATNQDDNQRMFLITTVIPVCAFTICILFVALMIALCMKRRSYSGYMKASQNSQLGPAGSPVILPDEIDRSNYPPSKPLILPHEKPPLPPPDYNMQDPLSVPHSSSAAAAVAAGAVSGIGTGAANNIGGPGYIPMTTCSYRSPGGTPKPEIPSYNRNNHTPSILSSPNSHDRFPHGVFG